MMQEQQKRQWPAISSTKESSTSKKNYNRERSCIIKIIKEESKRDKS
jgi:hypothetical protein